MKVSIYTECGTKTGYGHIVRCMAIAEAFDELGCDIEFFIDSDCKVLSLIKNFKYNFVNWIAQPASGTGDFFIFDSYNAGIDAMQNISCKRNILYIDDFQRLEYPEGSWILNPCPLIRREAYSKYCNLFLGTKYSPIRKEFWDLNLRGIRNIENITKILVMFGGSDIRSLAPPTIRILLDEFKDVEIVTIQGRSSCSLSETKIFNPSIMSVQASYLIFLVFIWLSGLPPSKLQE